MFDNDNAPTLAEDDDADGPKTIDWSIYTVAELVMFMEQIRSKLPPLSLKEMNLEEQMLLQFHVLRELQSSVISKDSIALNQRVQAANSVANVLGELVKAQGAVYTQERWKMVESLLIRMLNKLPEATAQEFIEVYERSLESLQK